ncbi:MAG: hypothetical protein ACHQD8_06930 [Chitinophagales bacterium]
MNLFKKPVICLAFALMVLPKAGFTQYMFTVNPFFSYFRDLKRYDLGFTYVMPFAHFEGVVPGYSGSYFGDTTAKRPTPGMGVGGSIGLSIPFKATGHISCWAVNFHLIANMYTWTNLNEHYGADGSYTAVTPDLEATTMQIALPIGIDYKIGNDAIETKRLAFGTSLGAGVMPNYNITTLTGPGADSVKSHGAFGFNPYIKLEGSVFLGIAVKIRVMYTLGDVTLIDVNKPTDYRINGPFKVTSNGNLMISLVFMPFSGGWYERKWYNTYDTYNQHDRLN